MSISGFCTKVVGCNHYDFPSLKTYSPIEFKREPFNPYDENAIAVYYGDYIIGYLNKYLAQELAPKMDAGVFYDGYIDGLGDLYTIPIYVKEY